MMMKRRKTVVGRSGCTGYDSSQSLILVDAAKYNDRFAETRYE
jgi:hypothetical protein